MSYTLPDDVDDRSIAIDGTGTLGRRIASVSAADGRTCGSLNLSDEQREAAVEYVAEQIDDVRMTLHLDGSRTGSAVACDDLGKAVSGAWMVTEAAPERLDIKREVFGQWDELADADAILASNSSSLPTSQFIDDVHHPERPPRPTTRARSTTTFAPSAWTSLIATAVLSLGSAQRKTTRALDRGHTVGTPTDRSSLQESQRALTVLITRRTALSSTLKRVLRAHPDALAELFDGRSAAEDAELNPLLDKLLAGVSKDNKAVR